MANKQKGQGSSSMEENDRRRDNTSHGSHAKSNNPGNFANDPERARREGRKGGLRSHGGYRHDTSERYESENLEEDEDT